MMGSGKPDETSRGAASSALQRWLALCVAGKSDEARTLRDSTRFSAGAADIGAVHQLAIERAMSGDAASAIELLEVVLEQAPYDAAAHCNRGNALYALGRLTQALTSYNRTLEIDPQHLMALCNRGVALQALARYEDAIASYDLALAVDPRQAAAHYNRGNALQMGGRNQEALESYDRALELQPTHANALINRGQSLHALKRYDEALQSYARAITLDGSATAALNNRGNLLRHIGDLHGAIESHRAYTSLRPDDAFGHSALIFTLLHARTDPAALTERWRLFEERFGRRATRLPHANSPVADRKLRIGYVSADLRDHPVAYHLEPVVENHGDDFEVYAYCDHDRPDPVTERIAGHCDHWRTVAGMADGELAATVQRDGIDILVDLAGHTACNRLLVFARKPAPVQVTWLGLPSTTGLSAIDYRLTDELVDPPGLTEPHHSERLVSLSTHACYRPPASLPTVNRLPALTRGYVTFASFNRIEKVTPEACAMWADVLRAVPRSRLLLICDGALFERIGRRFAQVGIAADRLIFVRTAPIADYLRWHHMVDIALDTFPFNGGTVTRNALWMGVPIVTLAGGLSVSRVGLALLSQIGLQDFVAHTPEQYVATAKRWASDLDRLADVRATLRERMQVAPFSDGAVYTRALEDVYRRMWRGWCDRATALRVAQR